MELDWRIMVIMQSRVLSASVSINQKLGNYFTCGRLLEIL